MRPVTGTSHKPTFTRTRAAIAAAVAAAAMFAVTPAIAQAGIGFEYARASATKYFHGSPHGLWFEWKLKPKSGRDFDVYVIRKGFGSVRKYEIRRAERGAYGKVRWNGRNYRNKVSKRGKYFFKVVNPHNGKVIPMNKVDGRHTFGFYNWIFPIRAWHNYGSGGARFGAARSGHSHQGQDVFARCGAKLRAPQGGRVQVNSYHSAAGHYIVLDLFKSKIDLVFMHLKHRSWAKEGWTVKTAQQIGKVGASGNAQGCHLHYEMWGAPGWYEGGRPFDPYRMLRTWDSWS